MDPYGIGNAYRSMTMMYTQTARRSGRTTQMLDRLKDGDRVVCMDGPEVGRIKQLCRERGLQVEIISCVPEDPHRLFERGTPQGQTVFEHTWVERYFSRRIERIVEDLDHLQRELSGYGEAHRETRRRAQEQAERVTFYPPHPGRSSADAY